MSRSPFVWEVQVRREVLDDELSRLREVPYSLWREVITAPMTKEVRGRDNRPYRLTVSAKFERPGEDIRVMLSLARVGLIRRKLMRQDFVITPENRFRF